MGTLLPFIRPDRVALVAVVHEDATFPRLARETARPALPLRPILHNVEIGDDHPIR